MWSRQCSSESVDVRVQLAASPHGPPPESTDQHTGNVFANIAVKFALCLVQEETIKTGFCHESVQAASLVVEEQEVVGGTEADE